MAQEAASEVSVPEIIRKQAAQAVRATLDPTGTSFSSLVGPESIWRASAHENRPLKLLRAFRRRREERFWARNSKEPGDFFLFIKARSPKTLEGSALRGLRLDPTLSSQQQGELGGYGEALDLTLEPNSMSEPPV